MKTNVVMIRKLNDFEVLQRTSDGMFNATALLNQWNLKSGMQKQMSHFTDNASTTEYINEIEYQLNTKERNSVLMQSRGKNGGTWMHPYLFIDFAMWLNPRFKFHVIRFVYDQLIQFRHFAGDGYKELAAAIAQFDGVKYPQIAKGLNYIVFNKHEDGLRQHASEEQLKELSDLEKHLAFAVNMGYIITADSLLYELRKIYATKYHRYLTAISN